MRQHCHLLLLSGTHSWHALTLIGVCTSVETRSSSAACMEERHDSYLLASYCIYSYSLAIQSYRIVSIVIRQSDTYCNLKNTPKKSRITLWYNSPIWDNFKEEQTLSFRQYALFSLTDEAMWPYTYTPAKYLHTY